MFAESSINIKTRRVVQLIAYLSLVNYNPMHGTLDCQESNLCLDVTANFTALVRLPELLNLWSSLNFLLGFNIFLSRGTMSIYVYLRYLFPFRPWTSPNGRGCLRRNTNRQTQTHICYKKTESGIWKFKNVNFCLYLPVNCCMCQYIILNNGILNLDSSVLPSSEGYIPQYTLYGVYGLIVNEINEVIISVMIVKNDIMSI